MLGLHILQAIGACLGAMIFIMPLLYPDTELQPVADLF
jgi:hypothetical protein